MRPLVDLEVLGAREHLAAAGKGAREGLLSRVHPDVVHQLVLGLEGSPVARARGPEARVRRALGATDVFHCEVRHDLVHAVEELAALLARRRHVGLQPLAGHLLPHGLPHVPEEGAVVRGHGGVVRGHVVVGLIVVLGAVVVHVG